MEDSIRDANDETDDLAILRRQVESLHRESQATHALAHLAAIVESSDDAIISKSLTGIIQSWNQAAERIFGYTAAEIVGQSIQTLIPPERRDEEMEILARIAQGERVDHFNTVRLTRDGRRIPVVVSISPIRDASGKVTGASKVLRDMSAAEQVRRDGEARLRGVVDNAVDGIITISESGNIESINAAVTRVFGYGPEEILDRNVKMLMPEPFFSEHDGYLENYLGTGQRKIIGSGREVMGKRKDGTVFAVDLAVSEVQLGDRRIFTGIVRDITQRKEAERALVQAKDSAIAASRAKEKFLSVLSHELRTPLTPVLAEMSYLEERTDLSEELRSRLAMVRRNIETEARIVDDLLDLTRIGRGKIQLHFEVVDLHETIRGTIRMCQSAIDSKSLRLALSLEARQHHVWADPGRLQQILLNLLSNALKFTPEDGHIAIATADGPTELIELEVRDSGIGIEPEMLGRLFDAFEQSDRSRRFGGLGLGLSIAKSLAEMHGGELTASSEGHDRGSSFRLALATVPPIESPRTPAKPAPRIVLERRILLVEDHDDTRLVMARLLRSLGCEVETANCVRDAIELAESGKFDLLISDIGLPDGSGLEVMHHFKEHRLPGIALSGFGQEEDLRRSREAGFEMHLTKPLNFNTLKEVLLRIQN